MQVSVETVSKIERKLTVVVPVEKVDEAYDKRIVKLAKTAKVKGFRAGKVPLEHIKQRFGESARQEALNEVIESSLYDAMHQEKLTPVSVPVVVPKSILPGQPLEYVATIEILPELGSVSFEAGTIEKEVAEIHDKDIDKVINHLQQQHVTWKKVDRAAQEKDQVTLDFRGMMDGTPFKDGEAHDYAIVLGSKTMIPGFEEGLIGVKTGEEKVLSVVFPENYFAKEFSGKPAEFHTKILKICEPSYPELNDAFIKKLGVKAGTVEDLQAEVRRNLERELQRVIKLKLKTQVFNKLLEQNPIEVPKALIDKEAERVHQRMHPHHKGHEHNHSDAEMQGFKDMAKKNVLLGLLVGELIKKYNLTPDQERIKAYIESHASAFQKPDEVIQWYSTDKRRQKEVEMQILEEQIVEKLLEGVKVTDKVLSYEEFVKTKLK